MKLEPDGRRRPTTRCPAGRRRRMLLPILPAGAAAGWVPKTEPPPPSGMAQEDRMAEMLQAPIPPGWILANRGATPEMILSEYVPAGQTMDRWTGMIAVMTIDRRAVSSLAVLAQRLDRRFRSGAGCAVAPMVEPATVRSDGPAPAPTGMCPGKARSGARQYGETRLRSRS